MTSARYNPENRTTLTFIFYCPNRLPVEVSSMAKAKAKAKVKAKAKAKRYTDAQKKEILDFIEAEGRGGQTKAVKKFKVTAASISSWKKKASGGSSKIAGSRGSSKELKALQELASLLAEIEKTEAHLATLQKKYGKAKAKL
ncbi:hypothetical protein N9105_03930 [Akkermansiaceae bacterium]|nr:hypothetical protein [Akkermansiaceae bacterium]